MSEKKSTGLASFTQRERRVPPEHATEVVTPVTTRKRGKGETVAITVRLTRAQWERLHQFAIAEGDSLQGLAIRGFAALLREKGLGEF